MKKLTAAHKNYLMGYVKSIQDKTVHMNSDKMNATLSGHGYVGTTLATKITFEGLQWLGYNAAAASAIMMLQAERQAAFVKLTDSAWIAVAQRYYIEASLWEQRYEVAIRASA